MIYLIYSYVTRTCILPPPSGLFQQDDLLVGGLWQLVPAREGTLDPLVEHVAAVARLQLLGSEFK